MDDKFKITIRIADLPPLALNINRDEEEYYRQAEYGVNRLWNSWGTKFKGRSSEEILAMIAHRFAELFYAQNAQMEAAQQMVDTFEQDLDRTIEEFDSEKGAG